MKKSILVPTLILLFLTSGCIWNDDGGSNGVTEDSYDGNNTIIIDTLKLEDDVLRPDRYTYLEFKVSNGNIHPAKNFEASLHNKGPLEIEKIVDCNFELRDRLEAGGLDSRQCRWSIKAPSKDYLKGFESKDIEMLMRISYETSTTFYDEKPFIAFEERPDTSEKSYTTDTGLLKAKMKFESPLPLSKEEIPVDIMLKSGEGRAENIDIEYQGAFDFSDCPEKVDLNKDGSKEINCKIEPVEDIEMREESPILLRINYKYVLSKSIELEISES